MKYIREASDIHLDVDISRATRMGGYNSGLGDEVIAMESLWTPPPMEGDDDTCFILAGDLWVERKFLTRQYADGESWLKKISKQFKYVVFLLGNHDYWRTNVLYEPGRVREEMTRQGLTNVFFLEKSFVVLDQVKFVGGTLWTDYNRHDPIVMHQAPFMMNDYRYMRWGGDGPSGYGKCYPNHLYEIHQNTKTIIFQNAKRDNPDQKVIVVTHMAPSAKSIHQAYTREQITNFYYYSDLEQRIKQEGQDIDMWFHGHMHSRFDYTLEPNVRVLCNPRGYAGYEQTGFDPEFRIEL